MNMQQNNSALMQIPGYDLFVVKLGLTSVTKIGAAIVCIFLSKSILGLLVSKSLFAFLANRTSEIGRLILKNILNDNGNRYESNSSQELAIIATFGAQAAVFDLFGYGAIALSEIILILLISATLVVLMPLIGILVLIYFTTIALILNLVIARKAKKMEGLNKAANISSIEVIQTALMLKQEISIYSKLGFFLENFNGAFRKQTKAISSLQLLGIMPKYLLEPFLILGALVIGTVSFAFSSGENLVFQITLVLTAATRILPSFLRLQSALTQISRSFALAPRVKEVLETELLNSSFESGICSSENSQIVISLKNVTFRFTEDSKNVIRELSFDVPRNKIFAISGESGSGKTTLINLMLGFLKPTQGSISYGLSRAVMPKFAMVPQFPQFIPGSIVENVAFGVSAKDIDFELVIRSLQAANIYDHIANLPHSIHEKIGESFKKFSGGQKQRVNIARALYTNPDVIVFDEPTSALDDIAKKYFIELMRELSRTTTIVVVSHDEELVRSCDLVLRLD
jgi:ABC-type bacteriocin/lantibiotic exporter with double-glycine peptidase domain